MKRNANSDIRRLYFSQRLISAMKDISLVPLTVVEASMGYGKTTAVRETLRALDARVLWQSIYSERTQDFWQDFCDTFSQINPQISENLRSMNLPSDSSLRREAVKLLSELNLSQQAFWVIDDYHLVQSSKVDEFLHALLRDLPVNLHIIVITRTEFFLDTVESRLKGQVLHVGIESLQFSRSDVSKYYRLCGFTITDSELDMLYSQSEGWVSSLYLFMLEFISEGSITGKANIHELVRHAVYAPLRAELKALLLCVGVFDSFDLAQAIYMYQSKNTEALLEELLFRNAFITKDRFSTGYHLHNLFSMCVREEFTKLPEEQRQAIWKRAGNWYMRQKEYLRAMECYHCAGAFDDLLDVLEKDKGNSLSGETMAQLIAYLTDCPKEVRTRHHFSMLVYARKLFGVNQMSLFFTVCAEFVDSIANDYALNAEEKDNLLGEYELLLSFTQYNDIVKMSEHHRKASQLLKGYSRILDSKSSWTFASPSILALFHRQTGALSEEVQVMQSSMPYYYRITGNHGNGAESVMEAEAAFCRGIINEAEAAVHRAVYQATESRQWSIWLCAAFLQCRLAIWEGDFGFVLHTMQQIREKIVANKQFVYYHTVDLIEAYIYALLGQPRKFAAWLTQGEISDTQLLFPAIPMLHTVFGRVLLELGAYTKLIGLSEVFLKTSSIFPNTLCQIYIYIHQASAYHRIFKRDEAIQCLATALSLASADELYMPFVENCESIGSLLWETGLFTVHAHFIARCGELYATYSASVGSIRHAYFTDKPSPLTERELEVARLAAKGLSNKEIGEQLFITENTVKTRLKNIYKKLGILSRAQIMDCLRGKHSS